MAENKNPVQQNKFYKVTYEYYIHTKNEHEISEFIHDLERQKNIKGDLRIECIDINEK